MEPVKRVYYFFRSRTGSYLIFCLVAAWIAGVAGFNEWKKQRDTDRDDEIVALPRIASKTLWEEDAELISGEFENSGFVASEVHENYQPLRPAIKRSEIIESEPKPKEEPQKEFKPWPSLIKFEQEDIPEKLVEAEPPKPVNDEEPKIVLEDGGLLHGQLLAQINAGEAGAQVTARLTRSLVQEGRIVLPIDTRLVGKLANITQEQRFIFDSSWLAITSSGEKITFKAQLQERGYDALTRIFSASDGQLGFPSIVVNDSQENQGKALLGKAASAIGRFSQDRFRTVFGEQIPTTVRNVALEGGSAAIEYYAGQLKGQREQASEPASFVEAGEEFYLSIFEE